MEKYGIECLVIVGLKFLFIFSFISELNLHLNSKLCLSTIRSCPTRAERVGSDEKSDNQTAFQKSAFNELIFERKSVISISCFNLILCSKVKRKKVS